MWSWLQWLGVVQAPRLPDKSWMDRQVDHILETVQADGLAPWPVGSKEPVIVASVSPENPGYVRVSLLGKPGEWVPVSEIRGVLAFCVRIWMNDGAPRS